MRTLVATAVACSIAIGLSHAADVQASIKKSVSIPAQGLATALRSFAQDRKLYLIYASEDVVARHTNGAAGELTQDEALRLLLTGTGLTFRYIDDQTVSILPVATSPRPTATESTTDAASPPPTSANDDAPKIQLEEITVTAQKREQRLLDVPISVTALSAEEITRRRLVSAEDYLRAVPGVNQVGDNTGPTIVIRGLETRPTNQNINSGATVATYFGETPTSSSAGLAGGSNVDIKLVDIERVEVLRGPQGTSFGNSALGGAVRTLPMAPRTDRFEGKVSASYSVTSGTGGDNTMIQAVGNIPLITDKLAIRANAYKFADSGFYRGVAGSNPAFQATAAPYGVPQFATDADEIGATTFTGGRIAALYQATDDLRLTLNFLHQKTEIDGQATANTGVYEQAQFKVAPEHVLDGGRDRGAQDTDIDLANATIDYSLSWASVVGTFSYIKSGATFSASFGSLPASLNTVGDHSERSGEVRITSRFSGPVNFLAGVYAEDVDDDADSTYYQFGVTGPRVFGIPDRFMGQALETRDQKQKAAFGEVWWEMVPGLTLTGGVRAYDYDRTSVTSSTGAIQGNSPPTQRDADATGATYRGNLSYKPTDDALLYATWSQGFRLGKPQIGLGAVCDKDGNGVVDGTTATLDETRRVQADTVDNYEIGGKLTTLERRLVLAADVFRMDWVDVPLTAIAPLPPNGCGLPYLTNAGEARSEGVEAQANFRVTEALRVDVGGSYVHARLVRDALNLNPPARRGARLPGSPKYNANLAVQYDFHVSDHEAFVRADSTYVGSFYGALVATPSLVTAGNYTKVDLSAGMKISSLDIDLFVRNVGNRNDYVFRGATNAAGQFVGFRLRPRTIGLQLTYDF
jgi:outer membrane receptor protein involved in Fe transport